MFEDDDRGSMRLNDAMSNPWVAYPYIALSGLASAASPALARGAHGVNTALNLGMNWEKTSAERKRSKRLNETLMDYTTPKPSTVFAPDTSPGNEPMSERRLDEVLSALPTVGGMPAGPARDYVQALAKSGQGEKAIPFLSQHLAKEPRAPQIFGSGETGYHTLADGKTTQLVPGVGRREPTPPRPVFSTQGGEAVSSVYNPRIQDWETKRSPLTAAPQAPKSPEELARIRSQIALDQARVAQIQNSIKIAGNAKNETVGQLGATLRVLDSMKRAGAGDDPTQGPLVDTAMTSILEELARRKRVDPAQEQESQMTADAKTEMRKTAPNMSDADFQIYLKTPRGEQNLEAWKKHVRGRSRKALEGESDPSTATDKRVYFETLPDPSKYKGRSMDDLETGESILSDGKVWRDSRGYMIPAMRGIEY